MHYVDLVAALAVTQFFFFGFMTAKARQTSGLKAPDLIFAWFRLQHGF